MLVWWKGERNKINVCTANKHDYCEGKYGMDTTQLIRFNNTIEWDFKFEDEFKPNKSGYTFVIDVFEHHALLALYRFSQYGCKSEILPEQPPQQLLTTALTEQGNKVMIDGLYYINSDIRQWIEKNILVTA